MIQILGNTIFPMRFNPMIKAHDSNLWQIIRQKNLVPTSNIKRPIFIGNIKPSSHWQYQKSNLHWQYQKAQSPLAISKAQFPLAISKTQFSLALFYQKSPRLLILGKEKISWYNITMAKTMTIIL